MLIPSVYSSLIIQKTNFTGPDAVKFSKEFSIGFTNYLRSLPTSIKSEGDIGSPGSGIGSGALLASSCSSIILNSILIKNFSIQGLTGTSLISFAKGFSEATCSYLNTANTLTMHSGVGVGTTFGGFTSLSSSLLESSILSTALFTGSSWTVLIKALSAALVEFLMVYVRFSISITGPTSGGVSTGTGIGKIL